MVAAQALGIRGVFARGALAIELPRLLGELAELKCTRRCGRMAITRFAIHGARMTEPKSISSLLAELPQAQLVRGDASATITAIEDSSRRVDRGALFIAIPGFVSDGYRFCGCGRGGGECRVCAARSWRALGRLPEGPAVIAVEDTRVAMAQVAAWFDWAPRTRARDHRRDRYGRQDHDVPYAHQRA